MGSPSSGQSYNGGMPPPPDKQVFAYSGILYPEPGDKNTFALAQHALSLAGGDPPRRVCYVPTAIGDWPEAIEACTTAFAALPDAELSVLRLFTQPSVPDVAAH